MGPLGKKIMPMLRTRLQASAILRASSESLTIATTTAAGTPIMSAYTFS